MQRLVQKTKNTKRTEVEVGCTVTQTSALFNSARLAPSAMIEVSVSGERDFSSPSVTHWVTSRRLGSLTLQPVYWATAGRLCRPGCTAARRTTWSASSARLPSFASPAHTPWHLREVNEKQHEERSNSVHRQFRVMTLKLFFQVFTEIVKLLQLNKISLSFTLCAMHQQISRTLLFQIIIQRYTVLLENKDFSRARIWIHFPCWAMQL